MDVIIYFRGYNEISIFNYLNKYVSYFVLVYPGLNIISISNTPNVIDSRQQQDQRKRPIKCLFQFYEMSTNCK